MINDADAAGVAEMKFGAGVGQKGTVLMLTLGTGIGSALFTDGCLVPNTEFGHIEIRGREAEKRAAESVREEQELSWGKWAGRVDEYLEHMEMLLSPQLIIIGGGVSRKSDKFLPFLTGLRATVVPGEDAQRRRDRRRGHGDHRLTHGRAAARRRRSRAAMTASMPPATRPAASGHSASAPRPPSMSGSRSRAPGRPSASACWNAAAPDRWPIHFAIRAAAAPPTRIPAIASRAVPADRQRVPQQPGDDAAGHGQQREPAVGHDERAGLRVG